MKNYANLVLISLGLLFMAGCGVTTSPGVEIDNNSSENMNVMLQELVTLALPCEVGKAFGDFAIMGSGELENGNVKYYGVAEVMGFEPEDGHVRNTCYRIAPLAMEISESGGKILLVDSESAENYNKDFLLEDYDPERDGPELDEKVKEIFSEEAFKVRQERNYREYFPDYNTADRKSFDERAMEYFNLKS